LARIVAGSPTSKARPIGEVDIESARATKTGVDELDRVLGGGLVPGAVVLMAGEPGVGKSTLLLEVAYQWSSTVGRSLYLTGEELGKLYLNKGKGKFEEVALRAGGIFDEVHPLTELAGDAVADDLQVHPGLVLVVDRVDAACVGILAGLAEVGRILLRDVENVVHRLDSDSRAVGGTEVGIGVTLGGRLLPRRTSFLCVCLGPRVQHGVS
jgi:predicted ATP-dependent serine protease